MLDKVEKFVVESYGKENLHLERTLYWVRELQPDASKELLIAACSHDIERAFDLELKNKKRFNTKKEMEKHQIMGGQIMFDFLIQEGYDAGKAKRVQELISKHEVGGDFEQNLLKDADSLSYLEVNVPRHINFIKDKGFTKEGLRKKFDFMYKRISFEKTKELASPFYEKAVRLLEDYRK